MNSWLRQHIYAIRVAFRRLLRTPFSSLCNIVVIAFVLTLPIVAAAVLTSLAPLTKQVSVNPTITGYMSQTTSLDETKSLADEIKSKYSNIIETAEVVDKTTALEALRDSPSWADAVDSLKNNPLPHAIIFTLKLDTKNFDDASKAEKLADALNDYEQIDLVQFDSQWVQKLSTVLKFGITILVLLAIGVAVVVIGTVFNTVRMQALVQRDEIAVARLLGATESFVCRPFLYFGAFTGLFAGILALILSVVVLATTNHVVSDINEDAQSSISFHLPDAWWLFLTVLITIVVAAIAARWSVSRNSKF